MASSEKVKSVEKSDNYYHVRYRDPDDFSEIRTPDWAADVAGSVVEGSEVRTGKQEGDDDWEVQSVLIPAEGTDESGARSRAEEIVEKLES